MEVKTKDTSSGKYIIAYVLLTFFVVYLVVLIVPGLLIPQYLQVFGTIPFLILIFFSIRFYIMALVSLIPEKVKPKKKKKYPFVSIIVPAFKEETVLDRTISDMLKIDYPKDRIEFLYVYESHDTSGTEKKILEYAGKDSRVVPLRRVSNKGGKAAPTNFGIEHAKGEIIGVFDADHSLDKDLVQKAVHLLRNKKAGCVRGRCRAINRKDNLLTRLVGIERDVVERIGIYGSYKIDGFSNFGGGHGFFRAEIFDELGLFDEDILNEDIDFSVRMHMAGYHVFHIPEMQSWEENPTSWKAWWNQRKRWSRGWMQVWRRYALKIPLNQNMSLVKRLDSLVSLSSSVSTAITIFIFPLLMLSILGYSTSYMPKFIGIPFWVLVTATPFITGAWVWLLDRREKNPSDLVDLLTSFLLLPYILIQFLLNWTAFLDEFVLNKPYSYVKCERADVRKPNRKKGKRKKK